MGKFEVILSDRAKKDLLAIERSYQQKGQVSLPHRK